MNLKIPSFGHTLLYLNNFDTTQEKIFLRDTFFDEMIDHITFASQHTFPKSLDAVDKHVTTKQAQLNRSPTQVEC